MLYKYPGKPIVFEGGEGSGKSTQIKMLAAFLRQIGYEVVETKEPRGNIREILMNSDHPLTYQEELKLFLDDRTIHFPQIIIPALKEGKIILCDRSSFSTIAYQHYGRGLDLNDILIRDAGARRNTAFDLIILLDLDPEIGLKRKKPETRFELEDIEFHKRVRQGYLEQAKYDPDKKWIVIDASKPAEEVYNEALEAILNLLYKKTGGKNAAFS